MAKLNLDALIAREDFEVEEVINSGKRRRLFPLKTLRQTHSFSQT